MNEMTLESFINFCEDMEIAEEGVLKNIGDKIWGAIKYVINLFKSLFDRIFRKKPELKNDEKMKDMSDNIVNFQEAVKKKDTAAVKKMTSEMKKMSKAVSPIVEHIDDDDADALNKRLKKACDDLDVSLPWNNSKEFADYMDDPDSKLEL